ncbi:hypothetical protein M378DRAFT_174248 [Amanita muscaria Koide BX008]|uniref:FHA domain-containing protein n=1 Tax=Amanita muscaria (strain Koide BX008) TaxID=946122 RepID=A0A0C2WEF0_AMAMK|nr:hypothetical protein M378DRAFT_174248 [Amanita muscaria Koide BX008]
MLRRKPNQNNDNQNNAQQQSNNVQVDPGSLSTSAPNPVYTPQIPVSAPSANPSAPSGVRIGHQPPTGNQTPNPARMGLSAVNALGSNKLAFKSKVVSRAHAEIWVEKGGNFKRDESRPHQLKDGDILQLGVAYQGGAEDIYKSVKIRMEVGRGWQAGANAFNTATLKSLKNLAAVVGPVVGASANGKTAPTVHSTSPFAKPSSSPPVRIHSTTNASVLIEAHPAFSCPLCRTDADLDEDVEVETADAGEAEEPADADTPVRESLEDGEANEQPNGTGNAAEVDGIHPMRPLHHCLSFYIPPPNAANPFNPFTTLDASHAPNLSHPHVHGSSSHANSSRLLPIPERDTDRDREAGGETEVEPDSMSPRLSLFGRRTVERTSMLVQHVQMDDEMDDGIIVQAEESEEPSEAEEIEMVDAIEYGGPCEDSAMGDDHGGIVHVVAVPVDVSLAELGFGSPGAGAGGAIDSIGMVGNGTAAGSIGSKRKR